MGKKTVMMEADQALQCLMSNVKPLAPERRPLVDALDYYLAEPIVADRDMPASDRAAMDGYAVRAADVREAGAVLKVVGEVMAGSAARPSIGPGECVSIFTGANVPADADTVVMVEDTELLPGGEPPGRVRVLESVSGGRNICRRGENARQGDELIAAGTCLSATHLGVCAAVGCASPAVHAKPRVAVLATGSELRDATESAAGHQIRDSNGPVLAALLAAAGFGCTERRCVPDDAGTIQGALEALLRTNDVVLVSGGVSVGKYDWVSEVVGRAGGTILYHGVKIKPGKPQLLAAWPDGRHVFGLPGNPLGVLVGMHEFVLPSLRRRAGCPADVCARLVRLPLTAELRAGGARQQYVLARVVLAGGRTGVEPVRCAGSADLVAAGLADGAVIVPAGTAGLAAGEWVNFRSWRSFS